MPTATTFTVQSTKQDGAYRYNSFPPYTPKGFLNKTSSGATMEIQGETAGYKSYGFIYFHMDLPAGIQSTDIVTATLSGYGHSGVGTVSPKIKPLAVNSKSPQSTYGATQSGNWTLNYAAGGIVNTGTLVTQTLAARTPINPDWYGIDVTSIIKQLITNHGDYSGISSGVVFRLDEKSGLGLGTLHLHEYAVGQTNPARLVVTYNAPGGGGGGTGTFKVTPGAKAATNGGKITVT